MVAGMTLLIPDRFHNRHPGTVHLLQLFAFGHLPNHLRAISQPFAELAEFMADNLSDGPELTAGLRKLREAKDCAVTQRVLDVQHPVEG
jgi:hypothetical protein